MTPTARNERRKLFATAMNNLGNAFIVTGLVAPGAAFVLGTLPDRLPAGIGWRLALLNLIYIPVGAGLMLAGRWVLRELE